MKPLLAILPALTLIAAEAIATTNLIDEVRIADEAAGFTQAQLSAHSGVALRSIQQWEGRSRKVAHAAAASVAPIARVLGTTSEALLAE